ncbi:MAG: Protease prsW family [Thermoleophilia bacterium]|nr:Protease prsW family [Thermoleophilia bacterium]
MTSSSTPVSGRAGAPEAATQVDRDAAHLRGKRRGVVRGLRTELGLLILAGCVLVALELGLSVAAEGTRAVVALVLAVASVPLLVSVGLWLDRFEPEPAWLLARTFLWGAGVAVFVAGILNELASAVLGWDLTTVAAAPFVEEALKGLAILWILRRRSSDMTGVLDGIVYALFVGIGFAVVENVQYYDEAITKHGVGGLIGVWVLRGLATPFLHPFFTMFTGIGVALAARPGMGAIRRTLLIGTGYGIAVVLHATWNSGIGIFLFPVIYAPAFILTFVLVRRALRRQRDMLRRHLEPEVVAGTLGQADLDAALNPTRRLRRTGASLAHEVDREQALRSFAYLFARHREEGARLAARGKALPETWAARDAELRTRLRGLAAAA